MRGSPGLLHFALFLGTALLSSLALPPSTHNGSHRHAWSQNYVSKKQIRSFPASIGGKDGPASRDFYEWSRLHDPATGQIPSGIRGRELRYARTLPVKRPSLKKGDGFVSPQDTWYPRGPANVGGRTRALAYDVSNPSTIIAGGVSGGIWRSTNAGNSWVRRGPANEVQSTTCLAQDKRPGRTSTWYYGTGELRGNSAAGLEGTPLYRGDGIFKSSDNGLSWSKLTSTATNNVNFDQTFDYVWNIALSSTDISRDIVVAACLGTIQVSTDGGSTWSGALGTIVGDAGPRYTNVVSNSQGVFYATLSSKNMISSNTSATHRGIWRSVDGLSWTNILPPGWPSDYNRVVAGIAPSNEDIVYFLAETPGTGATEHMLWRYEYLSGDGSGAGGNWSNRSSNLPNENGVDGNAVFDSQVSYDLVVAVYPLDENIVFLGGINLYRSLDGGSSSGTWTRIGGYASPQTYQRYSNNHPDHHALVFHPTVPTTLLNGNDGGIFRTATALGIGWTPLNNGYLTTQFYTIAVDRGTVGDASVMGGMQDNGTWYTSDESQTTPWTELSGGDGAYCSIEPGGQSAYVSFQNGLVYRLTGSSSGRIDPSGASNQLFINPFLLDSFNPKRMYYAGGSFLWRNNDVTTIPLGSSNPATTNWENISPSGISSGRITAIAGSKNAEGILFLGTDNGRVFKLTNAHVGTPSPADLSGSSGFPAGAYVSAIAVDPTNADLVLVSFSNYGVQSLFASSDGGGTWSNVSGNLEDQPDGTGNGPSVRWVSILPDTSAYYYFAATSAGLFSTRSLAGTGTVWTLEGAASIGYAVVDMVDVRPLDGFVAAGTHGNGAFSVTYPVTPPDPIQPPDPPDVPDVLTLSEPFPNPFNAGLSIEVSLPEPSDVTVSVYDISGRRVNRIAEGFFPQGSTTVAWNGKDSQGRVAASGIYAIVAMSSGHLSARKAVLIR